MSSLTPGLLFVTIFIALLPLQASAFGAGDIPDFAYLNDKAFRHGDIENILTNIAKTAGGLVAGGGILQFAQSVVAGSGGGSKFSKNDVKKVYFGNWLRDYSQSMDIAGLSKLSSDTLVLVVAVLGFMTFGFATEEFEVTADRLGVYLPVEHIDNPKGYAAKEGDARRFHPKLRPPVNPRELEIDPRNGMKNYMASENQGWDTSTAHIRRTLRSCIDRGRRAGGSEGPELWEAYRLLGTALHTLEDLLAHSNWCEIALRKMGHRRVFCHVGDRVMINTPNGSAPPLVTGTFGGADFLHSLMGEATDHLSQSSITDLSQKIDNASHADQSSAIAVLKSVLSKVPLGGGSSEMDQAESMQAESKAYRFNPDNVAPPEVQKRLWALLKWRDGVFRNVSKKIESIPGLESLMDSLADALNAYVYTVIAPWLSPILKEATCTLSEGSKVVIDSDDQYEVFNNPNASDPSHSLLSKDHFALILNEPAGKIAQVLVQYTVKLIVDAWFDARSNPDQVIDQVLEAFHHPYFNTGRSNIQNEMFRALERWVNELEDREKTLEALTKESVRSGKNKREGSDDDNTSGTVGGAYSQSQKPYRSGDQAVAGSAYTSGYGRQESSYDASGAVGGTYSQSQKTYRSGDQPVSGSAYTSGYGRQESSYDTSGTVGGAYSQSQKTHRSGDQPVAGSAYTSGYGRQESSYEQDPGRYEAPHRGSSYSSQGQTDHGRTRVDESQSQPWNAGATYRGDGQSGRDSSRRGEQRDYDSPRQTSYSRDESYEGRTHHQGGHQPSYGRVEPAEQRNTYDEQSYGRGGGYGEVNSSYGHREEERRVGTTNQPHRAHQYEESRQGHGDYSRSERRQEYGDRTSSQRGGQEYGVSDSYGERQGTYGGREYGRSGGGGYDDSSRTDRYGDAQDESYEGTGRSGGYGREEASEETFGAERLNLNADEGGYSQQRGYGGREEEGRYEY